MFIEYNMATKLSHIFKIQNVPTVIGKLRSQRHIIHYVSPRTRVVSMLNIQYWQLWQHWEYKQRKWPPCLPLFYSVLLVTFGRFGCATLPDFSMLFLVVHGLNTLLDLVPLVTYNLRRAASQKTKKIS